MTRPDAAGRRRCALVARGEDEMGARRRGAYASASHSVLAEGLDGAAHRGRRADRARLLYLDPGHPKGTITAASIQTDEGTSVAFREYFLTAMKGSPYVSDPSYSVITNKPALFFSSPIVANGVVLAAVRTRVNLAAIWDIVEGDTGS